MPSVIRLPDPSTGHGCWPSRPPNESSDNVFANKLLIVRKGDAYPTHCCGPVCHDGKAISTSKVFVNNKPIHRTGDSIDCRDIAGVGSPNVFADGP